MNEITNEQIQFIQSLKKEHKTVFGHDALKTCSRRVWSYNAYETRYFYDFDLVIAKTAHVSHTFDSRSRFYYVALEHQDYKATADYVLVASDYVSLLQMIAKTDNEGMTILMVHKLSAKRIAETEETNPNYIYPKNEFSLDIPSYIESVQSSDVKYKEMAKAFKAKKYIAVKYDIQQLESSQVIYNGNTMSERAFCDVMVESPCTVQRQGRKYFAVLNGNTFIEISHNAYFYIKDAISQ